MRLIESAELPKIHRLELALFVLGEKPGTQLGFYDVTAGEPEEEQRAIRKEGTGEFEKTQQVIKQIEALSHIKHPPKDRDGVFGYSILVARDVETLERLVKADRTGNDKEFGRIVGYPATAVEAYGTPDAINSNMDDYIKELQELEDGGLLPFANFIPSRSHRIEELEHVKRQGDLIKEKCPKLFAELVQSAEDSSREKTGAPEGGILGLTEGKILTDEDFKTLLNVHGFEHWKMGTYKTSDSALWLYAKRDLIASNEAKAKTILDHMRAMTQSGVLFPGMRWAIYRRPAGTYQVFGVMRRLDDVREDFNAESATSELRLRLDDSYKDFIDPGEASHSNNWGWSSEYNCYYPTDIEIVALQFSDPEALATEQKFAGVDKPSEIIDL